MVRCRPRTLMLSRSLIDSAPPAPPYALYSLRKARLPQPSITSFLTLPFSAPLAASLRPGVKRRQQTRADSIPSLFNAPINLISHINSPDPRDIPVPFFHLPHHIQTYLPHTQQPTPNHFHKPTISNIVPALRLSTGTSVVMGF
jgi:hypothetical protein